MGLEVDFQPMPKRFMVWDTKENKFLDKQNWAILPTQPDCGVTLPYENTHNPENIDEDCIDWADADLLTGRYLICQSTNLFDKDGKEIFEGSILQNSNGALSVVLYDSDEGLFRTKSGNVLDDMVCGGDYFKIIGHVLSNPELLEEGE